MKTWLRSALALLLMLCLVLTPMLVSCAQEEDKKDDKTENTTDKGELPGDTDEPVTVGPNDTDAPGSDDPVVTPDPDTDAPGSDDPVVTPDPDTDAPTSEPTTSAPDTEKPDDPPAAADPSRQAMDMISAAFVQLFAEMETESSSVDVDFWSRVFTGGSMEAALDLSALMEQMAGVEGDTSLAAKIFFGETSTAITANMAYMGMSLIDLAAFLDAENLVLYFPLLLGDGAYGISYEDLMAMLEAMTGESLDPSGDVTVTVGGNAVSLAPEVLEALTTTLVTWAEENSEELDSVIGSLKKALADTLLKNAYFTIPEGPEVVAVGGSDVSAYMVNMFITTDSVRGILTDLKAYFEGNAQLKSLLADFCQSNKDLLLLFAEDADAAISGDEFADALVGAILQLLDEGLSSVNEEGCVAFKFLTSAKDGSLVALAMGGGENVESIETVLMLTIGEDVKTSTEIGLQVEGGSMGIVRDPAAGSTRFLVISEDQVVVDLLFVSSSDGRFEISLTALDSETGEPQTVGVAGSFVSNGDKVELTITKLVAGETQLDFNLKLTFLAKDTAPQTPSYKNFVDLSEEELNGIITNIQSLLSMFGG